MEPDPMMDILDVLLRAGLNARGHRNWRNHTASGAFDPVGIMNHHIAGVGDWVVDLCYDGRPGLQGPLCNIVGRHSGELVVVSNRKGRDSGMGDPDVLNAMRHDLALPAPDDRDGHEINGNPFFFDFELEGPPFTAAQMSAVARANAAICREMNWSSRRCIDHKEWTRRKVDRQDVNPYDFRRVVQRHLQAAIPQEDDVPYVNVPTGTNAIIPVTGPGKVSLASDLFPSKGANVRLAIGREGDWPTIAEAWVPSRQVHWPIHAGAEVINVVNRGPNAVGVLVTYS